MPDPMGFSAFPQRGDTHRIEPHEPSASIGGRTSIPKDKRTLGQTNTLLERGVDFEGLRRERPHKVQTEMQSRDIGALLLTDTMNIRYATGVSVMPLWTATNLAHYVLVPAEGSPVIFEMAQAKFRAEEFFPDVRNAHYWQARFAETMAAERSAEWASEVKAVLEEWGVGDAKLGMDCLDYHGFSALRSQGIQLADADEPMEAARIIKTADEIELLKQSAAVCEAALYDLAEAIRPGVSEHELLGVFYHKMLSLGGEHCFSRLLSTGHKTNPWFHEAGSKLVRPGDLVAFDTDMTGPEGYVCDISRTFLCAEKATPAQREAYKVAFEFTQELASLLRPGLSYAELAENLPEYPDAYKDQRYSFVLHGVGTDDEPPFLPFPDEPGAVKLEGEFRENMVVSVEFYAGKVGEQEGVKLEDEVCITADGPVMLSLYPYEERLLA
jgi:Xaa-Pro aminopeptidase